MIPPSDIPGALETRARALAASASLDGEEYGVAADLARLARLIRIESGRMTTEQAAGEKGRDRSVLTRGALAALRSRGGVQRLIDLWKTPGALDHDFYRRAHSDLAEVGVATTDHYIRFGHDEGRTTASWRIPEERAGDRADAVDTLARLEAIGVDRDLLKPAAAWLASPDAGRAEAGTPGRRLLFLHHHTDRMTRRYRIDAYADLLTLEGWDVRTAHWVDVDSETVLAADRMVLCRTPLDSQAVSLVEERNRRGRVTVFDIDDLVFEADTPLARAFRRGLDVAGRATVSTATLARHAGVSAAVIPNAISEADWRMASGRITRRDAQDDGVVRLGYFSGSHTHDADFAQAAEGLWAAMRTEPRLRLLLMGDLRTEVPQELLARVERVARQPYPVMLDHLAGMDVVLAPLAPSVFNDAKSELKIFEAALHGAPTVASPTASYAAAIQPDRDGVLAATPRDWREALTALAADPVRRRRLGEAARQSIASRHRAARTVSTARAAWLEI